MYSVVFVRSLFSFIAHAAAFPRFSSSCRQWPASRVGSAAAAAAASCSAVVAWMRPRSLTIPTVTALRMSCDDTRGARAIKNENKNKLARPLPAPVSWGGGGRGNVAAFKRSLEFPRPLDRRRRRPTRETGGGFSTRTAYRSARAHDRRCRWTDRGGDALRREWVNTRGKHSAARSGGTAPGYVTVTALPWSARACMPRNGSSYSARLLASSRSRPERSSMNGPKVNGRAGDDVFSPALYRARLNNFNNNDVYRPSGSPWIMGAHTCTNRRSSK